MFVIGDVLFLQKNTFIEELDLTDNDIQADGAILLSLPLYENLYITDLVRTQIFCSERRM